MPETAQPTGETPPGTSSTPEPGAASPPAASAAPPSETKPTEPPKANPPADPPKANAAPKSDPAPKADPPPADAPLFTLPDDLQVAPEARSKFEAAIKGKLKDGRLELTAQDVVDLYAEQARDAYKQWETQVAQQDASWKAESEKRFSKEQLAAAETGVGFLSSFDPQFRDLTKGIANHPAFVNAMRVIGERLSEDTFEIEGARAPTPKKSAADVLYGKRN